MYALHQRAVRQCLQRLEEIPGFIGHTCLLKGNLESGIIFCLQHEWSCFQRLKSCIHSGRYVSDVHSAYLPACNSGVCGQGGLAAVKMKPSGSKRTGQHQTETRDESGVYFFISNLSFYGAKPDVFMYM